MREEKTPLLINNDGVRKLNTINLKENGIDEEALQNLCFDALVPGTT